MEMCQKKFDIYKICPASGAKKTGYRINVQGVDNHVVYETK